MLISDEKIAELKAALAADDQSEFEKTLRELARIFVAHERDHARRCDQVRRRERGFVPYLITER